MTTAVQHRRGTTAEHSTFTGLEGEVTIDTTKDTAVIHDGSLAGGYPLAKETLANVNPSTLSAITGAATASDDLFLMYDTSALAMKKISRAELNNAITIEALDTVDINGGTIDGTAIGGTTAAAGAFTTLSASGAVTLSGNTTLGDASTDTVRVNGYMGVGGGASSSRAIQVSSSALTGATQIGILSQPTANSAATSELRSIASYPVVADSAFTVPNVSAFYASVGFKGAAATATNWHGLYISDQTKGTNNYGITSLVSSGTNKWNIYASGTAANYFAGKVGIGTSSPYAPLTVSGTGGLVWGGFAANSTGVVSIGTRGTTTSSLFVNTASVNSNYASGLGVDGSFSSVTSQVNIKALGVKDSGYRSNLVFYTTGSSTEVESLRLTNTEAVFNDPGNDYDFRVESDTNTHALFLRGSDGNVGIGTSSPGDKIELGGNGSGIIIRSPNGTRYRLTVTDLGVLSIAAA